MGKKMRLPFFFKSSEATSLTSPWSWPSCAQQPRTQSFRSTAAAAAALVDGAWKHSPANICQPPEHPQQQSPSESSAAAALEEGEEDAVETVIRGLRSERLFFEPAETGRLILGRAVVEENCSSGVVLMTIDSTDPHTDFRRSMEEMVEAHGLNEWKSLEELLGCYLKVNGEKNHGYIVGAFVDLLAGLAFGSSSSSSSSSYCSSTSLVFNFPLSSSSSSSSSLATACVSSLTLGEDEEEVRD